jgi:signal transduction histidine kinase
MVDFDEVYCAGNTEISPGEYVLLALSDDGCGMSKEIADKIFEPFFGSSGLSVLVSKNE